MDAKVSLRSTIIISVTACVCGIVMGYCLFSARPDRIERERIAVLSARNKELEQRLSDNSGRARQTIGTMAVNLERQLQLATSTADLVGALRAVLEDLQEYYDSLGDYDSDSNSDGGASGND